MQSGDHQISLISHAANRFMDATHNISVKMSMAILDMFLSA